MAKEWGARTELEMTRDHNLEEGLKFTWSDGSTAEVFRHMPERRVYKVIVRGFERIVTEPFILQCMRAAGEDPQIDLYYSAWPWRDVSKTQKIVVMCIVAAFFMLVGGSAVALWIVTHKH